MSVALLNHLATTYADFHELDYPQCLCTIITNISNTMIDRVVVNHAAIRKMNENWGKTLNELHCHLHPLDTIASSCSSTLKALETCSERLIGNDGFAGNIVLQTNTFRYKEGKGDPKGFVTFLDDHNLPMRMNNSKKKQNSSSNKRRNIQSVTTMSNLRNRQGS